MKEKLTDLLELMSILGYKDARSAQRWCKENKIPVYKMGRKRYISSHLLTQMIDNQCVIFVERSDLPQKTPAPIYKPENDLISKYLKKYESKAA